MDENQGDGGSSNVPDCIYVSFGGFNVSGMSQPSAENTNFCLDRVGTLYVQLYKSLDHKGHKNLGGRDASNPVEHVVPCGGFVVRYADKITGDELFRNIRGGIERVISVKVEPASD